MEDSLIDDILLQLLKCKAQIEQVRKAKEECHQEMQTWLAGFMYGVLAGSLQPSFNLIVH